MSCTCDRYAILYPQGQPTRHGSVDSAWEEWLRVEEAKTAAVLCCVKGDRLEPLVRCGINLPAALALASGCLA